MSSWVLSADALPIAVVAAAFLFAITFSLRTSDKNSQTFIVLLFESVTLGAAVVIGVSIFYRPLFEWVTEHSTFMAIVALSTITTALKDIAGTIERSRKEPSKKK